MIKFFVKNDERGAITVDWVALTSGIILLGLVVVYMVMANSTDNLMDQFGRLNDHYVENAVVLTELIDGVSIGE